MSNVVLSKVQRRVLAVMRAIEGESAMRDILVTRDTLMSLAGEFVSDRTMRGLRRAGYVHQEPPTAAVAASTWTLTPSGRERADQEAR